MKRFLLVALLSGCAAMPSGEPLTEQRVAAVRNGMSTAEVEQLLGRPDGGTATYASGETVSGWRLPVRGAGIGDGAGIRDAYFNVHYRDGKVARTSRSADYVGG